MYVAVVAGLAVFAAGSMVCATSMPGSRKTNRNGPDVTLEARLRQDVELFAATVGERNLRHPHALERAAKELESRLGALGYTVRAQPYEVPRSGGAATVRNLDVELRGTDRPDELVVIGAHYDSVEGTPGADDNASGVAALLALAEHFAKKPQPRTIRFVAFVNEEPPYFMTDTMGSLVYAKALKAQRAKVHAMLSLETIGYFSDEEGSQQYPPPLSALYPSTGNFIGFVGNVASARLVRDVVEAFREIAAVPSEGAAVPGMITGVGWSDHWSFWEQGYPAVMVTDTAPFRNPHYHARTDTPQTLDYPRLAGVVRGLQHVIERLATR